MENGTKGLMVGLVVGGGLLYLANRYGGFGGAAGGGTRASYIPVDYTPGGNAISQIANSAGQLFNTGGGNGGYQNAAYTTSPSPWTTSPTGNGGGLQNAAYTTSPTSPTTGGLQDAAWTTSPASPTTSPVSV